MGSIAEAALYGLAGKFILYFVLLPVGLIFAGYLIFIIVGVIHELKRDEKSEKAGKRKG